MLRSALLALLLCALTPSLAQAQLYSWHDASGRLVISDRKIDPSAQTYSLAVGSAFAVVTTKQSLSARAADYDDLITRHATTQAINPDFVRAVIQAESAFNPRARSPKGAMGLMQLMPSTAAEYRVTDAYDPAQNIRAGVAYLKSLLTRFNDDQSLALAAYNAGPGAVEKYGRTVPPYRETRDYVKRITANTPTQTVSPNRVFRTVQVVNGQTVVRYTNKPATNAEVVVTAANRQ
jgi:soluble lytic murein transglycosylase-like protein